MMPLTKNPKTQTNKKIFHWSLAASFEGLNSSSTFSAGIMPVQRHVQTAGY